MNNNEYELVIIKHLKKWNRDLYFNILLKNTDISYYNFYKYAIKKSKKIYIYKHKDTGFIKAIIGFSDDIVILKDINTLAWFVLNIHFIHCNDNIFINTIITDIHEYALKHGQPHVIFNHINNYNNIFIINNYDIIYCSYCLMKNNIYKYHSYFIELFDIHNAKKVHYKDYYK